LANRRHLRCGCDSIRKEALNLELSARSIGLSTGGLPRSANSVVGQQLSMQSQRFGPIGRDQRQDLHVLEDWRPRVAEHVRVVRPRLRERV